MRERQSPNVRVLHHNRLVLEQLGLGRADLLRGPPIDREQDPRRLDQGDV